MPQEQILGRGKCYFDKFAPGTMVGTGEKYFGNTPSLSFSRADTALDHYDSDDGLKVKDISITLQSDLTGTLQTDNISIDNLALWFSGDVAEVTQAASTTALTEEMSLTPGSFYQLGVDTDHPAGVTNVSDVSFMTTGGTPAPIDASNFIIDATNGRFQVSPTAADIDPATPVTVSYKLAAATFSTVIAKGDQLFGAFRFISANAYGPQRNYYAPYCKLTADGDFALKGDDWQAMSFTLEILQKDDDTGRLYLNGRPM